MPGVGKAVGGLIGNILGSGDYTTNFDGVGSNSLVSSTAVPSFGGYESTVITHREYIRDIITSGTPGAFDIAAFPINPGQTVTFPWLASIASLYEEYNIEGMVFEYKSTSGNALNSTNTALGTVILATEYDPTKPAFTNKQQMENYFFAQSTPPSQSIMHAVECKSSLTPVKQLYTRSTPSVGTTDLRWSDYGNFYIATVGTQGASTTVGELWCSYKIKLFKPRLPVSFGTGPMVNSAHQIRSGVTTAAPLGTGYVGGSGPLNMTVPSGTQIAFPVEPFAIYQVTVVQFAATSVANTTFGSIANLATINLLNNDTTYNASGSSGTFSTLVGYFRSTLTTGTAIATINFYGGAVVGTATTDIHVTTLDTKLLI